MATHAGDLDGDAKDHDDAAQDHGAPPAQEVAHGEDEDGAHEAPDLVDGRHETLERGAARHREVVVERGRGDDAAHDALVVAEEEEARGRDRGHGHGQRPAREAGKGWGCHGLGGSHCWRARMRRNVYEFYGYLCDVNAVGVYTLSWVGERASRRVTKNAASYTRSHGWTGQDSHDKTKHGRLPLYANHSTCLKGHGRPAGKDSLPTPQECNVE